MYRSDWGFCLTLAVLVVVAVWSTFGARPSTTSAAIINGTATNTITIAQDSAYSSFFAAIGSASVIVLAWERIAHSRRVRLRHLMRRVCPTLFKALSCFRMGVQESKLDWTVDSLEHSISALKEYGWFHIDRLYPKRTLDELAKLVACSREYLNDLALFRKQVEEFSKMHGLQESLVEDFVHGSQKLAQERRIREGNKLVITYGYGNTRLSYEVGQQLYSIRTKLDEESAYRSKWKNGTWNDKLVQRAKRIQSDFTDFLDKHDLEIDQPAEALF